MPRFSSSRTSVALREPLGGLGALRHEGDVADPELGPLLEQGNGRVLAIGRPHGFEPREQHGDPGESETPRTGLRLHAVLANPGRRHLALQRAAADQLVEAGLVAVERGPAPRIERRRPDRLVGLLRAAPGLEAVRRVRHVLAAVRRRDLGPQPPLGLGRQRHRIGAHVGDGPGLVEGLRERHRARDGELQPRAGRLLERRRRERRMRMADPRLRANGDGAGRPRGADRPRRLPGRRLVGETVGLGRPGVAAVRDREHGGPRGGLERSRRPPSTERGGTRRFRVRARPPAGPPRTARARPSEPDRRRERAPARRATRRACPRSAASAARGRAPCRGAAAPGTPPGWRTP